MIQERYFVEIERTRNGWILNEIEEKPQYRTDPNTQGWPMSYVVGTEREVRQYVYPQDKFLEMLQHIAKVMTFEYNDPAQLIFIEDEEAPAQKKVIHS